MDELVYVLSAITSVVCAVMLAHGYAEHRSRLLLLGTLCFVGLAANSALLVIDRLVMPDVDLSIPRIVAAVLGLGMLAIGLIGEESR